MSKATDELEDALTVALGKYIRAIVGEAVETALADQEPVEEEDEKPKKKTSAERRKEALAKVDEDEDSDEEDSDEEDSDDEDSDDEDDEDEEDEISEADVRKAVQAALRIAERPEVIGLMKKHGKSDKASGVKPELRGAVIDALAKLGKKGSKSK